MTLDLDALDRKILAELTRNARLPIAELARRVGLSKTPVALRIRHLEEIGLITGYRAILSPVKLGLTHVTYVEVSMNDTRPSQVSASRVGCLPAWMCSRISAMSSVMPVGIDSPASLSAARLMEALRRLPHRPTMSRDIVMGS